MSAAANKSGLPERTPPLTKKKFSLPGDAPTDEEAAQLSKRSSGMQVHSKPQNYLIPSGSSEQANDDGVQNHLILDGGANSDEEEMQSENSREAFGSAEADRRREQRESEQQLAQEASNQSGKHIIQRQTNLGSPNRRIPKQTAEQRTDQPPMSQQDYLQFHMLHAQQLSQASGELDDKQGSQERQLTQEDERFIHIAEEMILSKEEIWRKLEERRFHQLKHAAANLQSDMLILQSRCPKCTLLPPCKHYKTYQEMIIEAPHFIQKPEIKQHLSPKKRDIIVKTLREQYRMEVEAGNIVKPPQSGGHLSAHSGDNSFDMRTSHRQGLFVTQVDHSKQGPFDPSRANRNSIMASTIHSNRNFLPGLNQEPRLHPSMAPLNLSKLGGQNYLGSQLPMVQSAQNSHRSHHTKRDASYLKKRQGNGGSPVTLETNRGHNLSTISGKDLVTRDKTTVRIRTKANQFQYQEGSFAHPLYSVKNEAVRKNAYSTLNAEPSRGQHSGSPQGGRSDGGSPSERDRIQNLLFRYREEKIQREIDKIEDERRKAYEDKLRAREYQENLKRYNEQLKERLMHHQQAKYQELQEKTENAKKERQRLIEKEKQRKQYYEQQRKYINEYKELKRQTDDMLGGPHRQGGYHHSIFSNAHNQSDMMFYERQTNFGFPITTTTAEGGVVTTTLGPLGGKGGAKLDPLDGASKTSADIKSGHVQLEEGAFAAGHQVKQGVDDYDDGEYDQTPGPDADQTESEERKTPVIVGAKQRGKMDSLDMVAAKKGSHVAL